MENLVIVVFPDADKVGLVGKKQNVENEQGKHGDEIDKTGADDPLRGDEEAGGRKSKEGNDEKGDELAGGIAHSGKRGRNDNRHGIEGAAGDDDKKRNEVVAKRDAIEEFEDWDAEEPGGEQTDNPEGKNGESKTDGETDKVGEVLAKAGFEGHEERLDDILAKESEDGSGHSDDAIDSLDFVGGNGVDGVFGGVDEVDAEEAEAEDEEAFFGEKPDFFEIGLF